MKTIDELDKIADELELQDPLLALAIDRVSDSLGALQGNHQAWLGGKGAVETCSENRYGSMTAEQLNLIERAKQRYGKIYPVNSKQMFDKDSFSIIGGRLTFWFNTTDHSTHIEQKTSSLLEDSKGIFERVEDSHRTNYRALQKGKQGLSNIS